MNYLTNKNNQTSSSAGYGTSSTSSSGGDILDKGVDFLERKADHEQSHSTTEKISDGIRKGYNKITGKDIPIADKEFR